MAGREQVFMQVIHTFIAAGASFFEVPITLLGRELGRERKSSCLDPISVRS